jgi:hypothetical protein
MALEPDSSMEQTQKVWGRDRPWRKMEKVHHPKSCLGSWRCSCLYPSPSLHIPYTNTVRCPAQASFPCSQRSSPWWSWAHLTWTFQLPYWHSYLSSSSHSFYRYQSYRQDFLKYNLNFFFLLSFLPFFLSVLGFELKASSLLGRLYYLSHDPSLFFQ